MNTGFLVNLVILIFAHLLGDFVVRFRWLRKRKRTFTGLLVHSLIHAALAYVLFSAWTLWFIPLVIGVSHLLIDLGKLRARSRRLWLFLLDQGLHGIVLILLAAFLVRAGTGLPFWYAWQPSLFWPILVVACAILLLVPCGGYLIGGLMAPYQEQRATYYTKLSKDTSKEGTRIVKELEDGGRMIGYLERLLILVFILSNQYAGIGFLIAAKSILPFVEYKDNENRMERDYIIIGTFASFLYALVISLGARWLLSF